MKPVCRDKKARCAYADHDPCPFRKGKFCLYGREADSDECITDRDVQIEHALYGNEMAWDRRG